MDRFDEMPRSSHNPIEHLVSLPKDRYFLVVGHSCLDACERFIVARAILAALIYRKFKMPEHNEQAS